MSVSIRIAALACVVAVSTSSVAWAEAPASAAADPGADPASDPALAEAQALYADGLTDYETFDYDLAIEKWKEALGRLREARPQTAEQESSVAAARNAIVYNIASAQEKAYAQDKDVARLKKARGLLERYVEEYVAAGGNDADELSRARARIDELEEQRLAALDAGPATLLCEHAEQRALLRALRRIPLELQVLLELYYWEDLTSAELAVILEIPHGTVRSRLRRGKQEVREVLATLRDSGELLQTTDDDFDRWLRSMRARAPRA